MTNIAKSARKISSNRQLVTWSHYQLKVTNLLEVKLKRTKTSITTGTLRMNRSDDQQKYLSNINLPRSGVYSSSKSRKYMVKDGHLPQPLLVTAQIRIQRPRTNGEDKDVQLTDTARRASGERKVWHENQNADKEIHLSCEKSLHAEAETEIISSHSGRFFPAIITSHSGRFFPAVRAKDYPYEVS